MIHKEHKGLIFACLAAFCTSFSAIFIRFSEEVPVTTMVFFRFFICSLTMLPSFVKGSVSMSSSSVRKHAFRAILGLISIWCYFYTVQHLSVMNAVTLSNTAPLFLPVVVFFWMKQIIPMVRFIALLIGFIGVVVILRPDSGMPIVPAFIGLCGGLAFALVQTGIRHLSKTESPAMILVHYYVIATVITFFPMLYFWESFPGEAWFNLAGLGVVSSFYQYLLTQSLHYATVTRVSAMNYLSVPFGGLIGWWFFSEIPSMWALAGTLLIICGGIIAILSKKQARTW